LKRRSTTLHFVAFLATGGLYIFPWLYLLMRDVNALMGRRIFRAGAYIATLVALFSIAMLGVIILAVRDPSRWNDADSEAMSRLIFVTSPLTVVVVLVLIVLLYKCILEACSRTLRCRDVAFIIAISIPWYLSLPYMQHKLNTLAKCRRSK
jgi:fumarate reductase subunit D